MLEKMTDSSLRNLVKFLEITGILKRTQRAGWVNIGVYQPESIADHTFRTAFLCMLYADMEGLDSLKLLRMALIHDLPEAVIGDLMPSQKTKETKYDEEKAMHDILALLPEMQSENYLDAWNEYQEGETSEAKAVQQLDKLEMVLQAREYKKLGSANEHLKRFIKSAEQVTESPELRRLLSCVLEEI
jgi:putative hydrolase of HD superfamily